MGLLHHLILHYLEAEAGSIIRRSVRVIIAFERAVSVSILIRGPFSMSEIPKALHLQLSVTLVASVVFHFDSVR